jgi:deazaflavin-dependent oxidoreductase (nitroreductase family)
MSPLTDHPPKGILRALLRLPIWLYRLNLGWLLGKRFLLLTHTGRKSGKTHRTVIEVVDHDPDSGTYTVASGWGEGADWYRNILKTPEVTIQVGRHESQVRAVPLSLSEGKEKLFAYAQSYPAAFRELSYLMMGRRMEATQENIHKMAEKIPLVALHPRE